MHAKCCAFLLYIICNGRLYRLVLWCVPLNKDIDFIGRLIHSPTLGHSSCYQNYICVSRQIAPYSDHSASLPVWHLCTIWRGRSTASAVLLVYLNYYVIIHQLHISLSGCRACVKIAPWTILITGGKQTGHTHYRNAIIGQSWPFVLQFKL